MASALAHYEKQLRDGDDTVLGELFRLCHDRLHRAAVMRLDTRLRGRMDPEDVVQESYLAALGRLDHFRSKPELSFFVWARLLLAQCLVDVYRASGPGGQKRNKIESAVRLRHQPTGISAKAEERRSQHENKARALKRLRRNIALHVRRRVHLESYAPSELLAGCISASGKLCVGRRDQRYHAAVWEILDVL